MIYNFDQILDRRNTDSFKWDLREAFFGNDEVLPLSIADADFAMPPRLQEVLFQRVSHPVLGYTVATDRYYQVVQSWMKRRHGIDIPPEWICSTYGVLSAICFAIQSLTKPGDGVIIQPPVYSPFFDAINFNDRVVLANHLIPNKTSHPNQLYYTIDFDDFERQARQAKLFILCSPHNPVGRVWTEDELKTMGDICKTHNVLILSDELHNDLVYPQYQHITMSKFEVFRDIAFTCMGPSKSFNIGGLYTALAYIPNPSLRKAILNAMFRVSLFVTQSGYNAMNVFGLKAAETVYAECEDWLDEQIVYLQTNRDFLIQYIENEMPMLRISFPEATYLAWIDFNALKLSHTELIYILNTKAKVALDTGVKYGDRYDGYMRLNFAYPKQVLEEGLNQIRKAIFQII